MKIQTIINSTIIMAYILMAAGALTYLAAAGTMIIYFLAWDGKNKARHVFFGILGVIMIILFIAFVVHAIRNGGIR